MQKLLNLIEKSLRKQRFLKLSIGGLMLVSSLISIGLCFVKFSIQAAFATSVLLFLIAFIGTLILRNAYRSHIQDCQYWKGIFNNSNNKIVWVYYHKMQSQPFGINMGSYTTLFVRMEDRNTANIIMPEPEILEAIHLLRQELPEATFGYSRQKEQLYNIEPDLLRR